MGDWRRLHNKELHDWFSSRNVIQVIKPRIDGRGIWYTRDRGEVHTGFWWGDLK
jgi:hypothetical protein